MHPTIGEVQRHADALDTLIAPDTTIQRLADGFDWAEGPVWVKDGGYLLFSDIPPNKIYQWSEAGGLKEFRHPRGYPGNTPRGGAPGSNYIRRAPFNEVWRDFMYGNCLRGDKCRYSHVGIDPSSGLAIGDDNAVPEQLIREGAKVPEGARVLTSGGDTDRMAELFKQAGVTTIAEFNAKQKALGFGLPNERERKPPPKASQAEIDEVLPLLQPLPESYRQAILAIPGCLGHILCGNQPVRRVHPTILH